MCDQNLSTVNTHSEEQLLPLQQEQADNLL